MCGCQVSCESAMRVSDRFVLWGYGIIESDHR